MEQEEYLDLVDENDQVIGRERRSVVHAKHMNNYRVVHVFIRNSKGELWIPRRTKHKALSPLKLDLSAAGHVSSGETYEQALKREVEEEINLDTDSVHIKEIGYLRGGEHGISSYQHIYEIQSDEVPNYNPNDFCEYYWLTPQALMERIENGDQAKSDLPILVKLLYLS